MPGPHRQVFSFRHVGRVPTRNFYCRHEPNLLVPCPPSVWRPAKGHQRPWTPVFRFIVAALAFLHRIQSSACSDPPPTNRRVIRTGNPKPVAPNPNLRPSTTRPVGKVLTCFRVCSEHYTTYVNAPYTPRSCLWLASAETH